MGGSAQTAPMGIKVAKGCRVAAAGVKTEPEKYFRKNGKVKQVFFFFDSCRQSA